MDNNEEKGFKFFIQTTKNPKPNAEKHRIKTIDEFVQLITLENMDRLLSDFQTSMGLIAHQKAILQKEHQNLETPLFNIEYWEWIDD